jgi:uncharacterized protein (DUF1330 family)
MSAYIVIHNVVTDQAQMQQYVPKAIETLTAHGAEILVVADGATVLEGSPPFPRTIILKFASREAAKAWYESPEYRKDLPLRLQATQGYAVLVDGLDATAS